jgi:hypothetical protein
MFGHLDSDEDSWAYNTPQARPSYQAAKALVQAMPGVAEDARPGDGAPTTPEAAAAEAAVFVNARPITPTSPCESIAAMPARLPKR